MYYFLKEKKQKELIILSLIYLASQGLLLIVSGRWWDDWCFHNISFDTVKEMSLQMGRPSLIAIIGMSRIFPNYGYRIITFIAFYYCMLSTYKILKVGLNLDEKTCFWISALYAVIPANDARIMLAVFPYTLGVMFFMLGASFFCKKYMQNHLNLKNRILSYIMFLFSFTLNSTLCFYSLILIMIVYKERNIRKLIQYVDYLVLPVIFFVVKSIVFPTYGPYAGYNSLSIEKIAKSVIMLLPADLFVLISVLKNVLLSMYSHIYLITLFVIISYIVCNRYKLILFNNRGMWYSSSSEVKENTTYNTEEKNNKILIIGFISLSMALFAYVSVRQTYKIQIVGIEGRDSVLISLGVSMILYSFVSNLFKERMQKIVLICFIIGGIIFYNTKYLSYQLDYYRQMGFMYELDSNQDINNAKNIIYIYENQDTMDTQRFYQLNANATEVYEKQDKYFITNQEDLYRLKDSDLERYVNREEMHMREYDVTYSDIDIALLYKFDSNYLDTIMLKIYEIFDKELFISVIQEKSSIYKYVFGTDNFNYIIIKSGYKIEDFYQ